MGYLYYHGCSILIDLPTNKQVDIHGVGRVKNSNYSSEEGITHYVLSWIICTQYFTNDIYAESFDNLKKEPSFSYKAMNIKLDETLGTCNESISKGT